MVFEDDGGNDDDIVGHSDSRQMVPQAPPKRLGIIMTPLAGHNVKQELKWPPQSSQQQIYKTPVKLITTSEPARSAPVHKQLQFSTEEKEEKGDGSAEVQAASDRATVAPRPFKKGSKSQAKKGVSTTSQAKPSQVRTRAQKCKKSDKAAEE